MDTTAEQVTELAVMTDPEFRSLLFADLQAGPIVRRFLSNPAAWVYQAGLGEWT
jgi:hypothetical protein